MSKADHTKQFIIEKAAAVFNIKGVKATSMSDIMEATKLSKGTHYVHFKDKDDLAAAAAGHTMQALELKINTAVNNAITAKDKLSVFTDAATDVLYPPIISGCLMMDITAQSDGSDPAIHAIIKAGFERMQGLIADLINLGISRREFCADCNGEEFATVMFAMIKGAVMMEKMDHNSIRLEIVAKKIKHMIINEAL